jgi:hypothetical protein
VDRSPRRGPARPGPADDATTAAQLRGVVERLIDTGQRHVGDLSMLVVADAGYDIAWLAFPPPGTDGPG